MDILDADEILDAELNNRPGYRPSDWAVARVQDEIERVLAEKKLENLLPTTNPVAVFALGVAGGVIGTRLLKGTAGLVIGGALAWWAYSTLSSPAETTPREMPKTLQPQPVKAPGPLPR